MSITGKPSQTELIRVADATYPGTGQIARLILLSGDLLNSSATADSVSDKIIFSSAHGLKTGSRVEISTPTGPLIAATTYYAIEINALEIKLAASLSNAQSNNPIDLTASGTIGVQELILSEIDPIDVLLSKELSSSTFYNRPAIANIGTASISGQNAIKPTVSIILNNSTGGSIGYRHYLVAMNANATIGSSVNINGFTMFTENSLQNTPNGVNRTFNLTFGAKSS